MVQAVQTIQNQIQKINKMELLKDLFKFVLEEIKKNKRPLILFLLIPFAESKAIFYNIDKSVSWYLFSDHQRQICMVVEDYCNIIIFGVVFWFLYEAYKGKRIGEVSLFLFILNALDLIHLGLMDMQYFIMLKLLLAFIIYHLWSKLKRLY